MLDGVAALVGQGLTGFDLSGIDVALPKSSGVRRVAGVTPHLRRDVGPVMGSGLPRTRPEWALIRAAQWARSDRQAWASVQRSPRRVLIDSVIRDVCDGAHSLGEVDIAVWCRAVVEIDGGHHLAGLNPVDDALRANEVVLEGSAVLRLPVLGLRLQPEAFMAQVRRGVEMYVLSGAA